eukprot:Sspe_Gene.75321::Locus_47068_Transcript_1_1_Confidence_1.000_Length_800::g.75321::m.75321
MSPPGNYHSYSLKPGQTLSIPCPVVPQHPSFSDTYLTYLSVRNATSCPLDMGCKNNTASCKTYPWAFTGNVGDTQEHGGRYYTAMFTNHDGDIPDHPAGAVPTGWTGDYADKKTAGYGMQLECTDGTWEPSPPLVMLKCGVNGTAYCTPSQPYCPGFPDTGVHTCRLGDIPIKMTIFES